MQASALDSELAYCARDAKNRPVIDTGPQAVLFLVSIDGRDGVALNRPKLLAGRNVDPTQPREALLDSRSARRFGVQPGDVIPIRVFPSFDDKTVGAFRCDPRDSESIPARSADTARGAADPRLVSGAAAVQPGEGCDRSALRFTREGRRFRATGEEVLGRSRGKGAWRPALDHPRSDRRAVQHDGLPPTDGLGLATAEDALRLAHRAAADAARTRRRARAVEGRRREGDDRPVPDREGPASARLRPRLRLRQPLLRL